MLVSKLASNSFQQALNPYNNAIKKSLTLKNNPMHKISIIRNIEEEFIIHNLILLCKKPFSKLESMTSKSQNNNLTLPCQNLSRIQYRVEKLYS